ncbi:hypothetical protein [Cupriavidus necator]|uniref:hypothetical protein n=1 Tax=Cupriavidus necator TaxID=106590 RepID=UPI00068D384F|nr:hypothetical protein [Cupriavidus necator]
MPRAGDAVCRFLTQSAFFRAAASGNNYSGHPIVLVAIGLPATEGLGHGTGGNLHGFMLHSVLAVTPEGLPLGVLSMKTWVRAPQDSGKTRQRRALSIREKESVKWLEGLECLEPLKPQCPDTRLVAVSDREGDMYDVFLAQRPAGVDWLVRAAWNRGVDHPEKYLWETVAAATVLGQTELQVPASVGRQARRAAGCALRAGPAATAA